MFYRNFSINATSVDPDQTSRFAASDQGLHCLPMSLLWDAKHKWVKNIKKQIRTDMYYFYIAVSMTRSGLTRWLC